MDFRSVVETERQRQGLTWRGLGRKAQVDPGNLSRWAKGQRGLTVENLERVLDALNIKAQVGGGW